MTIKKKSGRQEVVSGEIEFLAADVVGTVFNPAVELPQGARIVSGELITVAPAQAGVTVDVGDALVGNRYANDVSVAAAGRAALTPTGFVTSGTADVGVTFSAAPTQGVFKLAVQYVVAGRVAFSQGLDYRADGVRGA